MIKQLNILTRMTSKKRIINNLFNLVKSLKENTDDTIQKIFDQEKNIEQTNSLLNLKSQNNNLINTNINECK